MALEALILRQPSAVLRMQLCYSALRRCLCMHAGPVPAAHAVRCFPYITREINRATPCAGICMPVSEHSGGGSAVLVRGWCMKKDTGAKPINFIGYWNEGTGMRMKGQNVNIKLIDFS